MKIRISLLISIVMWCLHSRAQNTLIIQMESGVSIRAFDKTGPLNKEPQAEIVIQNVMSDTLRLEIEVTGATKYPVTFYLMDKGQRVSGLEFDYVLKKEGYYLKSIFMGSYPVQDIRGRKP